MLPPAPCCKKLNALCAFKQPHSYPSAAIPVQWGTSGFFKLMSAMLMNSWRGSPSPASRLIPDSPTAQQHSIPASLAAACAS